jgi:predicted nucleotidyltransferase
MTGSGGKVKRKRNHRQQKIARAWQTDKARRQRLLRELKRVSSLCSRLNFKKLILCGSVARGEVTPRSDLDLLAVQETTLPFKDRLEEFYALVQPRVAVDILIYTPGELDELAARRPVIRRMLEEGKVIYEEDSGGGS